MAEGSIQGFTALVTGANSGVGLAICHALAKEGVNLCMVARHYHKAEAAAKSMGNVKTLPIGTDLTKPEHCKQVVERCVQHFGGINILVNSAGILSTSDDTLPVWEECVELNLLAVLRLCKLSLWHLEKQAHAIIVNMGSLAGRTEFAGYAPYIAAKHGIVGFSKALFQDVREKNIKVITVEPGWIDSPMAAKVPASGDKSKMIKPDDVANSVVFACKFPENACLVELQIKPQHDPTAAPSST